ncbi:MAG: endopeptidase La [Erysipelotrichaceae bacterium]|nr:endopeptidase La [Erysipelotrichaceae bacterium]
MSEKLQLSVPCIATRGVVIFPSMDITIEVGREKSKKAVDEAEANFDGHCVLVCQKDLASEDPTAADLYQFGTLCRIKNIRKKDGYYRVTFSGLERAKILSYEQINPFFFVTMLAVADESENSLEELALVRKIAKEFESVSSSLKSFPPEIIAQLAKGVSAPVLADQFGQYFPCHFTVKQKILESTKINERLLLVLSEIDRERKLAVIEDEINDKVKERMEDNQKDYYLREKLRAIKEELGDVSNTTDDSEEIRRMINENPYPENIKAKALEELARYEMLPAASGESGVIRTYIDWLLKTPWWQMSEDNEDLNLVQQRLDEDHYGLDKVKERIMEYLAVKQMTKSLNSPILCLVGPPGVGKTSLATSIARAIDRKFVKVSLGGVHDESEIRGHRRTYLGSMPGRIIQGMKKAGVMNPVFLIDEIDKMASDYKGDPSSAMLEVLDPEQNKLFSDHYLEEPYDLSNVMFIATANYLEAIPEALKDRLEIIQLDSYTELEKVEICKRHLIPKQMKNTGLVKGQFKLSDAVILYLIRYYTREAGVRQLERLVASLCRKTVLAIAKGDIDKMSVTKKQVVKWLGKEKYDYGSKEKKDQVGVVTGLAYTSFGGDVLPVEVTTFDGKGNLIVTGQLGDVMKESTSIALDYVKSNAVKYQIDPKFFEKHDIHIHVPEGAVPKDGPSAGVTLTTALVSVLTSTPAKADIAMTGEVTLRGNVLPIGGLREKSMAAHRCGISTVVIPKLNVKDLDELPQAIKDSIQFIPVDTVDQVIDQALVK